MLALLLAVSMSLSFVACGNTSSSSAGTTTKSGTDDPYADPYNNAGAANDPYADPYKNAGAANDPYADPYKSGGQAGQAAAVTPSADEYLPEAGEKFTVTKTADGWIEIANKGGESIGLSPVSGVHIVEADGFAFKDLNQNGALDVYEDWRASAEDRAKDLVGQMKGSEMASILAHGGWGDFTTEPLAADDGSATYLRAADAAASPGIFREEAAITPNGSMRSRLWRKAAITASLP